MKPVFSLIKNNGSFRFKNFFCYFHAINTIFLDKFPPQLLYPCYEKQESNAGISLSDFLFS